MLLFPETNLASQGGQCDMPNQNDCDLKSTYCENAAAPTYYTCECKNGYTRNPFSKKICDSTLVYIFL